MTSTTIGILAALQDEADVRSSAIIDDKSMEEMLRQDAGKQVYAGVPLLAGLVLAQYPTSLSDLRSIILVALDHLSRLEDEGLDCPAAALVDQLTMGLQHAVALLRDEPGELTNFEANMIEWAAGWAERRHPAAGRSRATWQRLVLAQLEARRAYNDASDDDENEAESALAAAEDAMMDTPSPDAAGFAAKYLVAKGGGRETDGWDEVLEQEALRFAGAAPERQEAMRPTIERIQTGEASA